MTDTDLEISITKQEMMTQHETTREVKTYAQGQDISNIRSRDDIGMESKEGDKDKSCRCSSTWPHGPNFVTQRKCRNYRANKNGHDFTESPKDIDPERC